MLHAVGEPPRTFAKHSMTLWSEAYPMFDDDARRCLLEEYPFGVLYTRNHRGHADKPPSWLLEGPA